MMKIHILSLFPEMFDRVFNSSILKKAQEKEEVAINVVRLSRFFWQ